MLSVPSIIEIAKVSQYLAQNDIDSKGLYGGGIDLDLPQKLYNIRKSVEWMYNQDNTEPSLGATSEYLLAMCAKYRSLAQINLQPQIITSTLNNFGEVNVGLSSDAQFFTVRATGLNPPGYFDINSYTNFEISDDGVTWTSNLFPSYTTNTVAPFRVYVRFTPASTGYKQEYINILSVDGGTQGNATVFAEGTGVAAQLTASPSSIPFPTIAVLESQYSAFFLSGIYLENPPNNIVITSPNNNFELSLDLGVTFSSSVSLPYTSATLPSTQVTVKFIPQSAGVKSGNITIVGGGDSTNVAVTGTGGTALLTATPSTITAFSSIPVGTVSASKTFAVTGVYLQGSPNVVTITSPSVDFQVSNNNTTWGATTTIPFTSPTLTSTTVYVRFSPQSGGSKSGNVTVAGGGASTVNVAVSGAAAPASVNATALSSFGNLGLTVPLTNNQNYSASQTSAITGTGLDGTALTITGTTNFQISLNGTTWTNGTLNLPYTGSTINTVVYVRFAPLTVGGKSEFITISGGGLASSVLLNASGVGLVEFYISVVGATRIKMQYVQTASTRILWGDSNMAEQFPGSGTKNPDHTYTSAYTGSIVIQMNAYTDITQFYMNMGETAATSITINAFYFGKLTALTNCILDGKVSLIRYAVSSPMATSSLPQSLTSLTLYKADVGGTVQGLPSGLTFLDIRDNNTITGTIAELFTRCASLTNVLIDGSNTISGDIEDIAVGVTSIKMFGNNTITCATKDLSVIPTSVVKFRILGLNTISGSLQDISHWSTIEEFSIGGVQNAPSLNATSYITGTLNNITFSASLKIFQVTYGVNTISGELSTTTTDATHFQLPAGIETFELRGESNLSTAYGNTLIANIGDFPTGLIGLNVGGLNTITGNLNTYSSSTIRTFVIDGSNTISGSVSSAPANVNFFQLTGNTSVQTYTASRTWGASGVMNYFALYSRVGGYTGFTTGTQSQLNQLFVDLNVASWADSSPTIPRKIVYPRQGTVVPTGAGATALTSLTTVKGVTVTAETYP
jgi:hypothetical protein